MAARSAREPRRTNSLTVGLVALSVFAGAVFGAATFNQGIVTASWQKIRLIEGSFQPTLDLLSMYRDKAGAKAVDHDGLLPDVSTKGKLPSVDSRIASQAAQEHQLRAPDTFGSSR